MMYSKLSALRLFVLLALTLLVAAAPRAQAASSIPPVASSHDRADFLQFTSGGHVLGFAPREMYVASGSPAPAPTESAPAASPTPSGCADNTSCYGCLRNYRNQFAHQYIERGATKKYLEQVLSSF